MNTNMKVKAQTDDIATYMSRLGKAAREASAVIAGASSAAKKRRVGIHR